MIATYEKNGTSRVVIYTQLSPEEIPQLQSAIAWVLSDAINGEPTKPGRDGAVKLLKLLDDITLDEHQVKQALKPTG